MRVEDMDAGRLQRVFATNVFGPFLCSREAVRRMSTRHGGTGGAIVNVSSLASVYGSPNEYVDYAATEGRRRHADHRSGARSRDEGIRVNVVRAGHIYTEFHALRRRARPGRAGESGRADEARRPAGRGGSGHRLAAVGRGVVRHRHPPGRLRRTVNRRAADLVFFARFPVQPCFWAPFARPKESTQWKCSRQIPAEAIKLYDLYIHGEIPRREFMDRLNKFTAAGLALPALVEALMPNYAAGQQVAPTDSRIKTSYETVPSPNGNG